MAVKGWCPTTSSTFHDYLSNSRWTLSKTLDYSRGGCSGTFHGEALFVNIEREQSLLHYSEDGIVELLSGTTVSAHHQLAYLFDGTANVSVFFIDDPHDKKEQLSVESILRRNRFFHRIQFDQQASNHHEPVLSPHPCGPDMYHGRLLFESSDLFTLHWQVTGPRKVGNIVSIYARKG